MTWSMSGCYYEGLIMPQKVFGLQCSGVMMIDHSSRPLYSFFNFTPGYSHVRTGNQGA